jgi:hypothetical protein
VVFGSSPLVKAFHILHYSQGRSNILGNVRLNDGRRREGMKKKKKKKKKKEKKKEKEK